MKYVLGIDVGTTGTKTLLISQDGKVVGSGYQSYELITGKGGEVEQDARAWWQAVAFAVKTATQNLADKTQIAALSLSTQGGSSLLVDENNTPLCNALTWMDSRAEQEKETIAAKFGYESIYKKTGWPLGSTLDAAKLLWHKNHNAAMFAKATKYVSTIEYINTKLTGECVIDPTNGAIRQLMDIQICKWDEDILRFIGVTLALMPTIKQTGEAIGTLTLAAAKELGLKQSTVVYCGAHDQYVAALGVGAIDVGDMVLSTGTAWVTLCITEQPMFTDSCISPAKHVVGSLWGALTSIPVAGAALDWFKKIAGEDYDTINEHAAKRMENARDLLFYPYHIGAKLPVRLINARAAFLGLGLAHDKFDMYRAVMEGVAFQVKLVIDDYIANGAQIGTLRMAGGATKSVLWMQILSAVTGAAIIKSEQPDAACIGAAMIAAVGCGIAKDYKHAKDIFVKSQIVEAAEKTMRDFYCDKYARYIDAWDKMSKMYT